MIVTTGWEVLHAQRTRKPHFRPHHLGGWWCEFPIGNDAAIGVAYGLDWRTAWLKAQRLME